MGRGWVGVGVGVWGRGWGELMPPLAGISRSIPAATPATRSLVPAQSETTSPRKPHCSRSTWSGYGVECSGIVRSMVLRPPLGWGGG